MFVPLLAKSAATLIALAGDELVLGPLGELGPLDAQSQERRKADFPEDKSSLVAFKGFEQLREVTLGFYDEAVRRVVAGSHMPAADACGKAAELTTGLYGPLLAQLDAGSIAESARGLELGSEYACRLLRRYRPATHDVACRAVHRLIHGYPSHGFVVDLEELGELGLPAREPTDAEAPAVARMERVLVDWNDEETLVDVALPGACEP